MLSIARRHIILLTALFFIALSPCLHAQGTPIIEEPNYKPTLTFDIVSLHEAQPDNNFRVSVNSVPHSSRFEATDLPLKALVQIAYGFEAPIAGAPEWLNNTFWNIQCRSDEATDARLAKLTDNEVRLEKRNAIRVMLADRMGLQTHLETRNSAIYNLTIGKSGVKMQVAPPPRAHSNHHCDRGAGRGGAQRGHECAGLLLHWEACQGWRADSSIAEIFTC